MERSIERGEHCIRASEHGPDFNQALLDQFIAARDRDDVRRTHFFNERYENIYLEDHHAPLLDELRREAKRLAEEILGQAVTRMGSWFNAMGPGAETTLHSHDEDDERLSGVYYVRVPENSGKLIIHRGTQRIYHAPQEGQWVFFAPETPHAVGLNRSEELRLSVAFNFS